MFSPMKYFNFSMKIKRFTFKSSLVYILTLMKIFYNTASASLQNSTISDNKIDASLALNQTHCAVDSMFMTPGNASYCECDETGVYSCRLLNAKSRTPLSFQEKDKELILDGTNGNATIGNLVNLFPFLPVSNVTALYVSNWCKHAVVNNQTESERCSTKQKRQLFDYDKFNIEIFLAPTYTLKTLSFSTSCFQFNESIAKTLPRLRYLTLKSNPYQIISSNTFAELFDLQELDLSDNGISMLSRGHFGDLIFLTVLNLANNCLANPPEDLFHDLMEVQNLNLGSNKLSIVTNNIFRNNEQLLELILSKNEIEIIQGEAFYSLRNLQILDLSYNQLQTVPSTLLYYLRRLTDLYLTHNKISVLPNELFVTSWRIRQIYLNFNNLTSVPVVDLAPDRIGFRMQFLFFTFGDTSYVPIYRSYRTKIVSVIDLSNNCYSSLDSTSRGPIANERNTVMTKVIRCTNCCLQEFPVFMLHRVTSIADLRNNSISSLNMSMILYARNLKDVFLQHNAIRSIHIEWVYPIVQGERDYLGKSANPTTAYHLNGNSVNCDCTLFNFLIFTRADTSSYLPPNTTKSSVRFIMHDLYCDEPSHLRGTPVNMLSLSALFCGIDQNEGCPNVCKCVYRPYANLIEMNCTNRNLTQVPQLHAMQFPVVMHLERNHIAILPDPQSSTWLFLKKLYLSQNRLSSLQNLTVFPVLDTLHIDNNNLHVIEDQLLAIVAETNRSVKLKLAGNRWSCNCQMQKLTMFMFKTGNVDDARDVKCLKNNSDEFLNVNAASDSDLCPTPHHLLMRRLSIIIPAVASICVLLIIIVVACYFLRNELKFWLFYHGWCLWWVSEEDIDADKEYDAFVSYSALDEDWVCNELVAVLETEFPKYKLCIHTRDWLGGDWIPDQISRSVQQSRRTIIVLTENFVRSDWSRLEFRMAFQQMMTDHVKRILIVVPGKLPDVSTLDNELEIFVTTNTYLLRDDPYFWRKLRCAMPRVQRDLRITT